MGGGLAGNYMSTSSRSQPACRRVLSRGLWVQNRVEQGNMHLFFNRGYEHERTVSLYRGYEHERTEGLYTGPREAAFPKEG